MPQCRAKGKGSIVSAIACRRSSTVGTHRLQVSRSITSSSTDSVFSFSIPQPISMSDAPASALHPQATAALSTVSSVFYCRPFLIAPFLVALCTYTPSSPLSTALAFPESPYWTGAVELVCHQKIDGANHPCCIPATYCRHVNPLYLYTAIYQ